MIVENKALSFVLFVLAIVFIGAEYSRTGDFEVYYFASELIHVHDDIYTRLYGEPPVFQYFGSPFLSLILSTFTLFPLKFAAILFKLLNLVLLARIWKLIEKYVELPMLKNRQQWWIGLSFLAICFPLYRNFHNLQLTVVLIYCLLEGIHQIRDKKRNVFGAGLIAFGIMTKVSPIVVLPYLIYRRHFKAGLFVLLILAGFVLLPSVFLGWERNTSLWTSWTEQIDPDSEVNAFDMNSRKNHGVSAWLSSLLIEGIRHEESTLELRRHLFDLAPETVKYIILAVRLFLVAFMLYFLRSLPFRAEPRPLHQFWEISYLLLIIPLLFPQQRFYNFVFLLPAMAYLVYHLFTARLSMTMGKRAVVILGILLLNLELFTGTFRYYYWHYKLITYAALIILISLALMKPKQSIQSEKN